MIHLKKALYVVAITSVLAFTVTVSGVHLGGNNISAAAVGCRADGCLGLWPWNEGCQYDAYVVHQASAGDFTVFLWYSPACVANWGTIQYPACASTIHGVDAHNDWGEYTNSSAPACDGSGWGATNMVNGQPLAWACGEEGSSIGICTLKG